MNAETRVFTKVEPGCPDHMGARFDGAGTNFAVFSDHGERVHLSLFSPDGKREVQRLTLPERTGGIWHGYVPGLKPGTLYGYRVDGPYAPEEGHRFNPNKLLLDPYTRELVGEFTGHRATHGYKVGSAGADITFDSQDSAPYVPKSVVPDPKAFPLDATRLGRGWDDALIYEAHVKGATICHPGVPEELRGTYDGMASEPMIEHLTRLGVTAVELLPVHALKSEGALKMRSLVNYWGYNTIGFFAPEPRYFGPSGVAGFRAMVDRFHEAGIEVILDVVYNHSAESDHLGPTLSFRGLDNASYYRLEAGEPRYYVNDTGTGNTLNVSHPQVLRLVMDSLRFWVQAMGVDGFRFDLATTVAREPHGFDPNGGFLDALRQDPVLSGVKLIAEPWDVGPGGYQLGQFPPEFGEWNDKFRDTVRRFWRHDRHAAQDLGSALLGSAELFDRGGRRTWSSVNFAASHDGFTLADTTAYADRHNHANGEGNRDGHHANYSDNFGIEGPTRNRKILAARRRRVRNMLATVFVSQGTPMLLAGDEGGNSQNGNNNAYCQDNAISWIDWDKMDPGLVAFTESLSRLRRTHPVLRQTRFLHGAHRSSDGLRDVEWRDFAGEPLDWDDPTLARLCLLLRGCGECNTGNDLNDEALLAFNNSEDPALLCLPVRAKGSWRHEIDTSRDEQRARVVKGKEVEIPAYSLSVFVAGEEPA